jgi:hypothetical protein
MDRSFPRGSESEPAKRRPSCAAPVAVRGPRDPIARCALSRAAEVLRFTDSYLLRPHDPCLGAEQAAAGRRQMPAPGGLRVIWIRTRRASAPGCIRRCGSRRSASECREGAKLWPGYGQATWPSNRDHASAVQLLVIEREAGSTLMATVSAATGDGRARPHGSGAVWELAGAADASSGAGSQES